MAVSSPTGNIFADAAVLAADAYDDTPSGAALGWQPLAPTDHGLASSGTFGAGSYSFADGIYVGSDATNSAVAHVYEGEVNGETTLALAFRGTDEIPGDLTDHLHFTDHYAKFQPLIAAVETYVGDPAHGIDHVLVTGHSLGSAMVTTAMVEEGWVNDPKYLGVAIASHGTDASVAAMAPAEVTNLVNFVHTQDFLVLAQDNGLPGSTLAAAATLPSFGDAGDFEPKARVGSDVWIDTGNAVRLLEDGTAGNFEDPVTAEHRIGRYEADISTLAQQGALDPNAIQSDGPRYFAVGTDANDNLAQDQFSSDPQVNAELFPTKDFDQQIYTGAGDDRIGGSGGNDLIDGGAGTDTAYFRGPAAAYAITAASDGTVTVAETNPGSGPADGTDTLRNVEVLHFADGDQTASGAVLSDSPPPDRTPITIDNLINDPSVTLLAIRDEIADRFDHVFS
jgi:hypothetical protein